MKKQLFIFFLFISAAVFSQSVKLESISPQKKLAFKGGEWLKFRMSYSNFFNAGFSTIEVKETKNLNKDAFHIIGKGKSTGLVSLFFKVKDDYQTFIYKDNLKPYRFIRKIDEGGYTKDKEITFDYNTNEATVKNNKSNTETKHPINDEIQDILSSLYFLRSQKLNTLKVGDEIELPMFFDQEIHKFKLLFLGEEVIKTKFGKVSSLAFRPMVQAGRVFKEQESVTLWVSDDKNRLPIRLQADILVGSIKADLENFKNLRHPFEILVE